MVTGSVAGIIYGVPRMTHDIDLVVWIAVTDIPHFMSYFPQDLFYCPPLETIKTETCRKNAGHFNIIHHETGFKADIYPAGVDELYGWALKKRSKIDLVHTAIWVAPPEYVIIRKLQYFLEGGSPKHLTDIQKMLQFSADAIDRDFLMEKVKELELSDAWLALDQNL